MAKNDPNHLSRRERQIMDAIYQRERATAAEVQEGLPNAPSYSAVRALLAILVEKGHLKIEQDGARYVYLPTRPRTQAGRQAIRQVMDTFFGGSVENAVAALLDSRDTKLSAEEVGRLQELIEQSRKGGR
jgi:predicted transcriptional regulator